MWGGWAGPLQRAGRKSNKQLPSLSCSIPATALLGFPGQARHAPLGASGPRHCCPRAQNALPLELPVAPSCASFGSLFKGHPLPYCSRYPFCLAACVACSLSLSPRQGCWPVLPATVPARSPASGRSSVQFRWPESAPLKVGIRQGCLPSQPFDSVLGALARACIFLF